MATESPSDSRPTQIVILTYPTKSLVALEMYTNSRLHWRSFEAFAKNLRVLSRHRLSFIGTVKNGRFYLNEIIRNGADVSGATAVAGRRRPPVGCRKWAVAPELWDVMITFERVKFEMRSDCPKPVLFHGTSLLSVCFDIPT